MGRLPAAQVNAVTGCGVGVSVGAAVAVGLEVAVADDFTLWWLVAQPVNITSTPTRAPSRLFRCRCEPRRLDEDSMINILSDSGSGRTGSSLSESEYQSNSLLYC
jgi:hypothetical protein